MVKGIYCLLLQNTACTIIVGALGPVTFTPGFHVYVGSAQGSGGLKRVIRHINLNRNYNRNPRWHIDYLLTNENFVLCTVVCAQTDEKIECLLAKKLNGTPVPFFGCSDCTCNSHLLYYPDKPLDQISQVFHTMGLNPNIKTIIYPNCGV
jgi:Uri superfamily endonuclease